MSRKKIKKALGIGLGVLAASKFAGAKADALKKAAVDTGDFGSQMANDTNLAMGNRKALLSKSKTMVPKKKPDTSFLGKTKKFFKEEVFTTNPKTKAFTIPKGSGDTGFGLGPMDGAKKGKMIKAKGGKEIRFKTTKLY